MTKKALIIEDDKSVSQLIRLYLSDSGYDVIEFNDGIKGQDYALSNNVDIILLDLNLPGIDGIKICKNIRKVSNVPVIMVTARVDEADKLEGLDIGADDYVTKPFSPRELISRVNAVLRRSEKKDVENFTSKSKKLRTENFEIDIFSHKVMIKKQTIKLTPTEFNILKLLMENEGRIFSRDQIINEVFGYDFEGYNRNIDTHISNLRKKIENIYPDQKNLESIYGVGYKFEN
ncbi:MAG: DNA-binding response regulator [Chloroflexi bacterium]|nr:DNA-binding response regulator [Chloroflexota bacterium]|tara:strand:+ start:2334 stop:3029 length:696 start_codon:yes stop_codon:yes gene_type:complete